MKNKTCILTFVFIALFNYTLKAQEQFQPVISFEESPVTHNMHITSDGEFYYTVNGGIAEDGMIQKFSLDGNLIATYNIELDMRSIMYSKKGKKIYVSTYSRQIYLVKNLKSGKYKLVHDGLFQNEQSTPALSEDGKLLYCFSDGVLEVFQFASGKPVKTIPDLSCGNDFTFGNAAVAVGPEHIYTFDGEIQTIYIYDYNGKLLKEVLISDGDYGFSISYANGLIFVSSDGNYDVGTWYGYDLWAK